MGYSSATNERYSMALSAPSLSGSRSTEATVASKKELAMHVVQQPHSCSRGGGLWDGRGPPPANSGPFGGAVKERVTGGEVARLGSARRGRTRAQIAAEFGVTRPTVYRH